MNAFQRAMGTRARRWLAAITVALGLLAAVALATVTPESERTFAAVLAPTQLLMSLPLPFLGVLMASDLRHARMLPITSTILAGVGVGVVFAALGIGIAAVATLSISSTAAEGPWARAGIVVLGSVLVQVLAQLTGIALGLLSRSSVLACAATIGMPLGLWLLLGAVEPLRPAQPWLTPFPSAQRLLGGQMTPLAWTQWLVVVVIWGSSLNAYAAARHRIVTG